MYVIITDRRYWGKADTLLEAAKNAKVNAKNCEAFLYRFDPAFVSEVGVTEMGGIQWTWSEMAMQLDRTIRQSIQLQQKIGHFNIRISKGCVQMTELGD